MAVRWTRPAAQDLERIVQRIQEDNPIAARQMAQNIAIYRVHGDEVDILRIYHSAQNWP